MTRNRLTSVIIALVVVIGSAAALVNAQNISRTITLNRDAKIGGQILPKGEYSIKFVDGKEGQLSVVRNGREVAKANYRLNKMDRPASDTVLILNAAADGSFQVSKMEFKGLINTLIIE
ncbi:MAG: hypothetical protein DMF61_03195 [Blastocatellia bacterium AA13]|nr:MAG: hypothetical protein DMF61_03195 [Blastocatellia bacterium AA13]